MVSCVTRYGVWYLAYLSIADIVTAIEKIKRTVSAATGSKSL